LKNYGTQFLTNQPKFPYAQGYTQPWQLIFLKAEDNSSESCKIVTVLQMETQWMQLTPLHCVGSEANSMLSWDVHSKAGGTLF
jgi:hypothetical protein